jgi:cytosine/adenosine deaminase-related metal-dependent hydrolase
MKLRLVAGGKAADVDGGLLAPRGVRPDMVLHLGGAELLPGLVNAHDHLHRNHLPRLGRFRYPNVYAWGDDLQAHFAAELRTRNALPRRRDLLFGALKNLLGGATTVVHHDPWEPAFERDFPVRVARLAAVHSLRLDPDGARSAAASDEPFSLHLAEGTDHGSADEVREAEARGLLGDRLLAVHAVGADADGIGRLRRSGAAVAWCPTSNRFLYGETAPAALLAPGVDVLLGTDALVSGEGTLLDELAAARREGALEDGPLREAVGSAAARRLGLPPPSLAPGAPADLVALSKPLFSARPRDVALVLVAGRPALADEAYGAIFRAAGVPCEALTVGGARKLVAAPLGAVAREVFDLTPACRRIVA